MHRRSGDRHVIVTAQIKKSSMKFFRVSLAFALVVSGVASTVGSGGGGPPQPDLSDLPNPKIPPSVDITVTNARDVTATVVQAVDLLLESAATIGGQVFPSPPAAPDLLPGNSKFNLFSTVNATGMPVSVACAVSGSVTVSGYPSNVPLSLSMQDEYDLVFEACDDGDGSILDGSFSLTIMELFGDPSTDVFRLRYNFVNMDLTVASGLDSYTASRGFSLALDSLAFPEIMLVTSGAPLQLSRQVDVYSWAFFGREHLLTVNADISVSASLFEVGNAIMESAALGGAVTYGTNIPLQSTDGQDPESGEIQIASGFGTGGKIRIVIESSASVRLEIDEDGDGTVDDYQYTTWAALQSWEPIQ
jgi:hypothetical protein